MKESLFLIFHFSLIGFLLLFSFLLLLLFLFLFFLVLLLLLLFYFFFLKFGHFKFLCLLFSFQSSFAFSLDVIQFLFHQFVLIFLQNGHSLLLAIIPEYTLKVQLQSFAINPHSFVLLNKISNNELSRQIQMIIVSILSLIGLHVLHYLADLCYQFEFLFLSDVVDDTSVDTIFVLPEDQALTHLKCTF